jgi:hypothetical protein
MQLGGSDMITKTCSVCCCEKPLNEFGKDQRRPDGHGSSCSSCANLRKAAYKKTAKGKETTRRSTHSEANKARQHRYYQSEKGRATTQRANHSEARKKWLAAWRRDPAKRRAGSAVNHATERKGLPPARDFQCALCPRPASVYHHTSGYSSQNWFSIIPVCRPCHYILHHQTVTGPEAR